MLSRVAESIYWMNRYVERAENVARFIDVNFQLVLDTPDPADQQWEPLINTSGDDEDFAKRYGAATQESAIEFLTFDTKNPNSIISCLRAGRENARSVREVISSQMWLQLNKLYLMVNTAANNPRTLASQHEFLSEVILGSHLFAGATDATMTHSEGWHFGRLGRELERADKTSRLLDVKYYMLLPSADAVGTPFDDVHWTALLRSASAFEMYRQRYGRISPKRIIEFLLLDSEFPRAARFSLQTARDSLHSVTGTPLGSFHFEPEKLLGQVCSDLSYTSVAEIIDRGLHEYVDDLQDRMNQVAAGVHDTFFASRKPQPDLRPQRMAGR